MQFKPVLELQWESRKQTLLTAICTEIIRCRSHNITDPKQISRERQQMNNEFLISCKNSHSDSVAGDCAMCGARCGMLGDQ